MNQPLWQPLQENIARSNITAFMRGVEARWGNSCKDYPTLYQWSIHEPERFWLSLWDFSGIIAETRGDIILQDRDSMPGAQWFPDARLNFAENLLRRRDDGTAIVFWGEDRVRRKISFKALYEEVSRLAQAMRSAGVRPGDRVAGYLPNLPEAILAMLATASLGAVWSSCSPDFGVQGVLDRFGQIEPKILFTADSYFYGGQAIDCTEKVASIVKQIPSLRRVIVVSYAGKQPASVDIPLAVGLEEFIAPFPAEEIRFERFPFNHPLYILYSSGTTGVPKCIVHGAGGTLIQHLKEHLLHADIQPGDRLFYFTTCGWMMWNWLTSGLASGATLMLYDGSPLHPDPRILFDYIDREAITVFGTSAKYIDALHKQGLKPRESHRLDSLKTILSTGSPLTPENFDFVYRDIKENLCLSSISGGTDIVSCFVLGCPILPVWRGEIQCRGLGMKVEVFDEEGRSLRNQKGELVCTAPFPSMPLGFWNDPDGSRYRAAYFERFPNVWCHGDYVELTEHEGIIIHGRSDAVLNPGGVRIGTAEIYRQVEQLDEIIESLVIGQDWDNDVRVVLFVRLREGCQLDAGLMEKIKKHIRANTTPRHVPAKIVQVSDIPRTRNGKIVELAVRNMVHGLPVKNIEALANPEALEQFRNIPELQS